jgi:hypothetical protein
LARDLPTGVTAVVAVLIAIFPLVIETVTESLTDDCPLAAFNKAT